MREPMLHLITEPVDRTPDWVKWLLTPAILVAAAGFIWRLLRPAVSRLTFYLLETDVDRAHAMMFKILRAEDGRVQFRAFFEDVMGDFVGEARMAAAAVRRLSESSERQEERLDAHSEQLTKIHEATRDVPRLADAIDSIAVSLDKFATEMSVVNTTIARMDEREKSHKDQVDRIERRVHQISPHPSRRADDRDEESSS